MTSTGKPTPWGERFIEMVKQGPVEKEVAVSRLSGLVPPGQAWRTYERTFQGIRIRRGTPEAQLTPNEDGIRSGARQIVVAAIVGLKQRGRIRQEVDADGRVTYYYVRDPIVPTKEQQRERGFKSAKTTKERYGEDFFARRSREMAGARTPESRREAGVKSWLAKTPEQRAEIIRKGLAKQPPEVRSKQIREGWAKVPPEERSRPGKERWAKLSPEERSARARKGVETRQRRAWFRERDQGQDDAVSTGPEEGAQQDQRGRERGTPGNHEGPVG